MYKDIAKKKLNQAQRNKRFKANKLRLLKLKPRQYIEAERNVISPAPGAPDVMPVVGDFVSLKHQGGYLNSKVMEVRHGFIKLQVGGSVLNERWLPYK
jgi:hypothetical protein